MPLRASVRQGKLVVRPLVGLMVDPSHTFLHVLQQALDFKDRHALGESDVERIVSGVVDVTCVEKQRTADDITFSVLSSSTIASALVWGEFNDILFDIPSIVEVSRYSPMPSCVTLAVFCSPPHSQQSSQPTQLSRRCSEQRGRLLA